MPISQNYTKFLPATLKVYKSGKQIEYYVENPTTNKLCRKIIKVNKIFSRYKYKKDALLHVNSMISVINEKLASGYNPFFDGEDSRLYTPMHIVCDQFVLEKEKECRPDTIRCYKSFINQFSTYIAKETTISYISMINHATIAKYMDYCYLKKKNSNRTYNNQLKIGRVFFNWCIDKYYAKGNPFEKIKGKRNQDKKRTIILPKTRKLIINELESKNDNFLIVCKLMYYSLIRETELTKVKIKDIHLDKHFIYIPNDNAKNHKSRYAALTPDLIDKLQFIKNCDPNMYLISTGLLPGHKQITTRTLHKRWANLRTMLKLPDNHQLNSMRDTGIFEMLKSGIDDLSVMQHANHHSLDITTIYANHYDVNLIEKIYNNAPEF